jgi:hypothetical protein
MALMAKNRIPKHLKFLEIFFKINKIEAESLAKELEVALNVKAVEEEIYFYSSEI